MAGPPLNPPLVKPCEICGDIGYVAGLRVCCRCKISCEHAYCMKVCNMDADPRAWICEACELGEQLPSSKPSVSFACPSPDASKQSNNTTARSNLRKPPRNTKVQYISPEEAMGLESGVQKKISTSPRKSSLSCRPTTINRTPSPKFTVKPSHHDGPPGFIKLPSPRSLPNTHDGPPGFIKLPSPRSLPDTHDGPPGFMKPLDTQKHVVQKQYDCQGSPSGINLSSKTAQTSYAATEERNKGPAKLYRETSAKTSVHLEKVPKSVVRVTENSGNASSQSVQHSLAPSSGPVRQLGRETSAAKPSLSGKSSKTNAGRQNNSPGYTSPQSVQGSTPVSSDKGPVRQLGRETPAAKPSLSGRSPKTNAGRQNLSPGHTSPQSAQGSTPVSSDKGPVRQVGRETPASKPSLSVKSPKTYAGRENMSPGHYSPQSVQGLTPVSSDKGLSLQLLGDNSAVVLRADIQGERIGAQDRESMGVNLEVDKHFLNHPSEFPTWMGRFKIEDDDVVLQCRSLDEIRAHPPCKVHRKAYELSKQLPRTLQFELRPRLNTWVSLFEDDVPGELDIALYFLSSNSSFLLSYMGKHDMLLRSQVNGAELLVFSSRHLPEDSQRINKELFFWGLFRETEDNTMAIDKNSGEDMNIDMSMAVDGDSGDDMDIDMSGGKEVGIIDKVVPKPTSATSPHPTVPDPTPVRPSATSSLIPDEFEMDLERCLNKFVMLKQPENFQVKKEVESPGDG